MAPVGEIPTVDVAGKQICSSPTQCTEAVKGSDTPAHEAGHMMQLPDKFGQNGTIMNDEKGDLEPTEEDILEIINNPRNIVYDCVRETGKCTRREEP
jgi:hypothetical protein